VQRTPTVLLQRSATPTDTHEMRRGEVPSHSPIRTSRRIHALFDATHANQNSASATALGRMVNYTVRHILCNLQSLRFMAHAACDESPCPYIPGTVFCARALPVGCGGKCPETRICAV
jgi:hypothetical protein